MLNISDNQVNIDTEKYRAFDKVKLARANIFFRRWMLLFSFFAFIVLFLPWTQNIRAKGQLTTLTPDQRPQTIHATIAGRVEKWHVREGQLVKKGDTIVRLSEVKTEYFDPNLLPNTQKQADAKSNSVNSYAEKVKALDKTIGAMRGELGFKLDQLKNKIEQTKLKIEAERADVQAVKISLENEQKQFVRFEEMYRQGIKSLIDLENKRLKLRETEAKLVSSENKLGQSVQEIEQLKFQLSSAEVETSGKIAKAESDKQSTRSDGFAAEADVSKLQIQYANYAVRAQFYVVVAPQDCYITAATTMGIGEIVKEGAPIVSIVPAKMDLAVELFIDPIDLPLVKVGAPIRFIFDGWPSFIFSGWPNASVGTYAGRVFAIDNVANAKGKFRLLVAPDAETPKWPNALRPGSGAQGFALLKDVPVWYELWRQLNGFPPDYYGDFQKEKDKKEKSDSY
jgi:membrane fusion protein, adhesin transport system